jgi:methionine sulfoxide reductase catalytic subunit
VSFAKILSGAEIVVKWIEQIEFIESEKQIGEGEGGTNEDIEYFDELTNI